MPKIPFRVGAISVRKRRAMEAEISELGDGEVTEIAGVRVWRTPSRYSGGLTIHVGPIECTTRCFSPADAAKEIERLITTDAIAQCPGRPALGGCRSRDDNGLGRCIYCGRQLAS